MEQWMAEAAEEELRALEAHYPNRFSSLKLHLKSLISDSTSSPPTQQPSSDLCSTQASSTGVGNNGKRKRKDRADLAMERAEECLEKIRRVKESLAWW